MFRLSLARPSDFEPGAVDTLSTLLTVHKTNIRGSYGCWKGLIVRVRTLSFHASSLLSEYLRDRAPKFTFCFVMASRFGTQVSAMCMTGDIGRMPGVLLFPVLRKKGDGLYVQDLCLCKRTTETEHVSSPSSLPLYQSESSTLLYRLHFAFLALTILF